MALRVACQEILDGMEANCEVRTVRGWKLLLVLPRMMLFRPDRGGPVSRKKLEAESDNSRKASGSHFCVRVLLVQRQHTVPVSDVVAAVQMRKPSEPRGPSLWCRWESSLQPDRLWKGHHLHQETSPRWGCSQTL